MGKSKPDKRLQSRKKLKADKSHSKLAPLEQARLLLDEATNLLQTGQPDQALPVVKKSLQCLSTPSIDPQLRLPAIGRLAEVYIELGEIDLARETFLEAARLDTSGDVPDEMGGGADKFLWLAQLSEEGGSESVGWFEKGIVVLRRQVSELEHGRTSGDGEKLVDGLVEKKDKLANALCGAAEVYMTDLSWEDDAEARCEALVTEACLVAPHSPEPLQTLASVRISQTKFDDARAALNRSLELWTDLPPEDPNVPKFPTRISLARLLMEAELEQKALTVLERLVAEDDSSVEAWYLGGWCLHLLAGKLSKSKDGKDSQAQQEQLLSSSRDWLENSLRLYSVLDYEDDRLKEHSQELVAELNKILGPRSDKEEQAGDVSGDEEEWEDEDEDEDEEGTDEGSGEELNTGQKMSGT